jgi:hypothetical protein
MDIEYSKPLVELPSFLSTISMVADDHGTIIQQLIQAERKSPPKYGPTRDLFIRVLQGDFSFEAALKQTSTIHDETERRCAIDVLRASEWFLRQDDPAQCDFSQEWNTFCRTACRLMSYRFGSGIFIRNG